MTSPLEVHSRGQDNPGRAVPNAVGRVRRWQALSRAVPARRRLLSTACLAVATACSGGGPQGAARADSARSDTIPVDSITRRQRDSAIGASGLPGAAGVRGALDASDAAAERAALIDSLSGGH